ncbi:1-deoxy-D-xylulose 5-phosphate reductoisomerase [compost metagenome]
MAYECGRIGGTATTVFNAANEVAVSRFLNKEISFLQIEEIIERTLSSHIAVQRPDLSAIQIADKQAREMASSMFMN